MPHTNYQGKRFVAFLVTGGLILVGLVIALSFANSAVFGEFAMYTSGAYGVYCAGQSVTDNTKAKAGQIND